MKNAIDPRTTRRTVPYSKWSRNSALFSTYAVLTVIRDNFTGKPVDVVLQRKPEFCRQQVSA